MTIKSLRTPDGNFENLPDWPYSPHYIENLPRYDGLRLHYVDEGPKDGVTFLCLHGEPTWSYLYRKMGPVFLAAGHRFVAPDLFGFGRSDKPVDDNVYTFHFHRNALLAFVEQLDLKNICLVVQDWGGLLGLTLPLEAPERYSRLIVMNTALPAGEVAGPGFANWSAYNRANPDLNVGKLMQRATPILSNAEAAAYDAPFPDQSYKGGVRRFPDLVMVRATEDEEMAQIAKEGIETTLKARKFWKNDWSGESFMAAGVLDPVFNLAQMKGLARMIKNCPEPIEVQGGHFVQEWGEEIASAALAHFDLN